MSVTLGAGEGGWGCQERPFLVDFMFDFMFDEAPRIIIAFKGTELDRQSTTFARGRMDGSGEGLICLVHLFLVHCLRIVTLSEMQAEPVTEWIFLAKVCTIASSRLTAHQMLTLCKHECPHHEFKLSVCRRVPISGSVLARCRDSVMMLGFWA
jgi:hypothetical protein